MDFPGFGHHRWRWGAGQQLPMFSGMSNGRQAEGFPCLGKVKPWKDWKGCTSDVHMYLMYIIYHNYANTIIEHINYLHAFLVPHQELSSKLVGSGAESGRRKCRSGSTKYFYRAWMHLGVFQCEVQWVTMGRLTTAKFSEFGLYSGEFTYPFPRRANVFSALFGSCLHSSESTWVNIPQHPPTISTYLLRTDFDLRWSELFHVVPCRSNFQHVPPILDPGKTGNTGKTGKSLTCFDVICGANDRPTYPFLPQVLRPCWGISFRERGLKMVFGNPGLGHIVLTLVDFDGWWVSFCGC